MRTRIPAALAITGALALAACGSDDTTAESAATTAAPAATAAPVDDEMADDEMSDDEMSDDEMSDDEMEEDSMMEDSMNDEEMAAAAGDVVTIAASRPELSTLVAAIEAAGLAETLAGDGPFTIFAPTDEAFEEYLGVMGMTLDDAAADPAALATLLQNHVVSAADDSSMVESMVDVPFVSLAGNELAVTVDGDTTTIGGATIIEADIFATNGVIHLIDTVLAP